MSKRAEDAAERVYPHTKLPNGVVFCMSAQQVAYKEGYEQAENDLALTWKDMQLIWQLCDILNSEQPNLCSSKDFYTEVLNRFNKSKEEK